VKSLLPLMAVACTAAFAQPAFDVASVKPSGSPGRETVSVNPGSVAMHNISLRRAIQWAWEAPRLQFSGPDWLPDEHFDISAKAADAASVSDMRLMLRTLLAERLGVRLREERREMPVYFLVLAKNGPRFHEPTPKDATKFAESVTDGQPVFGRDKMLMIADHVSIADLAEQLSDPLQRPVVDKTGLKGRYDFRLDPSAYIAAADSADQGHGGIDAISMILTALPGQLGLKVEAGKETVRFWIVEAANKVPTGN